MNKTTYDINSLLPLLPHRYPFLLVDRVIELHKNESIIGLKNITANEPQFTGHFPDNPIMPGVLILEALAQTCGLLLLLSLDKVPEQKVIFLSGINNARFRQQIIPGDQLHLHATLTRQRLSNYKFTTQATVNGKRVADAQISIYASVSP